MKTVPLAILVVVAGLIAGGGAAFATGLIVKTPAKTVAAVPESPTFVATGKILAPLVFSNGRLAGYVSLEAQLETAPDQAEFVRERLPLLLHAVNMRTYRTPMASGPDGMLPDLTAFRALLMTSSAEAFGADVVKRAAITQAAPA